MKVLGILLSLLAAAVAMVIAYSCCVIASKDGRLREQEAMKSEKPDCEGDVFSIKAEHTGFLRPNIAQCNNIQVEEGNVKK